jgi:DNA-binding MarR family transcriptional regulator
MRVTRCAILAPPNPTIISNTATPERPPLFGAAASLTNRAASVASNREASVIERNQLAEAARVCACFNLRKAARAVTQLYDGVLQPSGLRSTQFVILVAIQAEGTVRLPDLARTLNVDRSTLTRNLQPLVRNGLIKTTAPRNARANRVRLLAKGRRLLERALPLWKEAQSRFEARIGVRRWKAMVGELSEVVEAAHDA